MTQSISPPTKYIYSYIVYVHMTDIISDRVSDSFPARARPIAVAGADESALERAISNEFSCVSSGSCLKHSVFVPWVAVRMTPFTTTDTRHTLLAVAVDVSVGLKHRPQEGVLEKTNLRTGTYVYKGGVERRD